MSESVWKRWLDFVREVKWVEKAGRREQGGWDVEGGKWWWREWELRRDTRREMDESGESKSLWYQWYKPKPVYWRESSFINNIERENEKDDTQSKYLFK